MACFETGAAVVALSSHEVMNSIPGSLAMPATGPIPAADTATADSMRSGASASGPSPGQVRVAQADLDACASEPIRIPGGIQPHGCLLVIEPLGWTVVQASANCAAMLDVARVDSGFALADLADASTS